MIEPTHWMFTYGTLKYERHGFPAEARGELRRHPAGYAVARFDRHGTITGRLEQVADEDLAKYDARESGYRRRKIEVRGGPLAWTYEYTGGDFDTFPILAHGIWRENP